MTTLDQRTKENSSKPELYRSETLPRVTSDELEGLQRMFPWMFQQYVDERTELRLLFPWLSGPCG